MKKQVELSEKTVSKEQKKKGEFFELRIPRMTFRDTPINGFLVFTIVVFAFLLGMLTNKVMYLEKQAKTPAPTAVANAPVETPYPTAPQVVDVDSGKLPALGDKNAKVTVVEFSDFECPFCQKYFNETMKKLDDAYIKTGKILFAYRHYPLNSIHPLASKAAEASECANEQGQFWAYHDKLFTEHDTWSALTTETVVASFTEYAGQLGLNTDQFNTCLTTSKYASRVTEDTAAGAKVQVDGTPTFFVNGYRVVGAVPFSELQKVIDQELAKVK